MSKVKASHMYARISPTKVRHFTALVKGMTASQGLEQLRFLPNRGAKMLEKVLQSAVANAEDRGARSPATLKITEARVDMGPSFKRVWPRGRGRADMLQKKFAHIHVALDAPELS
ncbi:50S ribosomal protein L22 [Rubinisphaera italica]|uniref:Large ribosomal subunit protein uL22 n=1 Tax=Rubinisphaera italica TaxID=2527969 RepID=A0A5C5XJ94_9PLAN|nr:50S ribosomal protein L22 [Rubinisphaera italica]TWT63090.1 50S ribosomal protein L22 [Rubinisphaera italica]HBN77483.1 50S ribosomal protein L22 [Planctomycetaceae bacterium]